MVVAVVVGALGGDAAGADETGSAKAHYARGTKLYDLGRYAEAAKEYEATYELKDDPALLFNIGQAYRLGHQYPEAIRAYKSFLRRVPESPQRTTIEGHLKTMQDELDRQAAEEAAKKAATTPTPTQPQPQPTASTPTTEPTGATTTSTDKPIYKKWWLWTIVGGVVVVGVVVGVTVGVVETKDSFNPSLGKVGPAALEMRF